MDIFRGSNFKAFYISCALVTAQQFCGINAVLFYMAIIFERAGASLEPAIATIIIGSVQVNFVCCFGNVSKLNNSIESGLSKRIYVYSISVLVTIEQQ